MKNLLTISAAIIFLCSSAMAADDNYKKGVPKAANSSVTATLPVPPTFYNSTTDINLLTPVQLHELAKYQVDYFTFMKQLSNDELNVKQAEQQICFWQSKIKQ